jgi:hypothetical protein
MSRFLDGRGRIFGKVNLVDVLVVLVVIALLVFGVARIHGGSSTTVPLGVTFRVQQVRKDTVDHLLQARGTLKDDSGTVLGTVEKVTAQPSQEEVLSPLSGKLQVQKSPLFQDVDITVRARAVASGGVLPYRRRVYRRRQEVGPSGDTSLPGVGDRTKSVAAVGSVAGDGTESSLRCG